MSFEWNVPTMLVLPVPYPLLRMPYIPFSSPWYLPYLRVNLRRTRHGHNVILWHKINWKYFIIDQILSYTLIRDDMTLFCCNWTWSLNLNQQEIAIPTCSCLVRWDTCATLMYLVMTSARNWGVSLLSTISCTHWEIPLKRAMERSSVGLSTRQPWIT